MPITISGRDIKVEIEILAPSMYVSFVDVYDTSFMVIAGVMSQRRNKL